MAFMPLKIQWVPSGSFDQVQSAVTWLINYAAPWRYMYRQAQPYTGQDKLLIFLNSNALVAWKRKSTSISNLSTQKVVTIFSHVPKITSNVVEPSIRLLYEGTCQNGHKLRMGQSY